MNQVKVSPKFQVVIPKECGTISVLRPASVFT